MCQYCEKTTGILPPPLPVEVSGNMITPETTTVQVFRHRTTSSILAVTDKSYFTKADPTSTGIGTSYVPILFCPMCGRYLGPSDPNAEKVNGISEKLRNELWELHVGGCTDSDIEDFIRDKRLSRAKAGAVWTQIYVWMAPDCCKGCRHVWQWRNCCCSRKYSDKYEPRNGESV